MAEEKLIRNPKLIIGEAEKVEAEVVGADDIVVVTDEEFYTAKEVDDLLKNMGEVVNYTNITNCITEIPQDIKLELNNGTLILKAGSKVYVPNGFEQDGVTPKFDEVTIPNDMQAVIPDIVRSGTFLTFNIDGRSANLYHWSQWNASDLYSGSTAPTASGNKIWYDTTNNVIKEMNDGVNWSILHTSFPFCTFSGTATSVTSIDHVFNGFGYIGSTVFALPGLKGLIPDGRNADGSLKSIEFTVSNVLTETDTTEGNDDIYVVINSSGVYRKTTAIYTYNKEENLNIYNGANDSTTPICWLSRTSGIVSKFTPKQVFHAVDYSDTEYIAHQAMPSDRYVDLTLGGSGTQYTAPADGCFFLHKAGNAAGQYLTVVNRGQINFDKFQFIGYDSVTNGQLTCFMPAKKGDIVKIGYSLGGQTYSFRFIYAQGAQ